MVTRAEECRTPANALGWTEEHRWCHSPYTRRCVHARALPDQRTQHARRRPLTPPAPCHESGLLSHAAVLVVVDRYQQILQAQGQRLRPWLRSASRATHILPEGGGATASNAMTGCGPTCLPPPPRTRPQPQTCTSNDQPNDPRTPAGRALLLAYARLAYARLALPTHAASAAAIHDIAAL